MRINELAEDGWIVEVLLTTADERPDSRFFAVGVEQAMDAENAMRFH